MTFKSWFQIKRFADGADGAPGEEGSSDSVAVVLEIVASFVIPGEVSSMRFELVLF